MRKPIFLHMYAGSKEIHNSHKCFNNTEDQQKRKKQQHPPPPKKKGGGEATIVRVIPYNLITTLHLKLFIIRHV